MRALWVISVVFAVSGCLTQSWAAQEKCLICHGKKDLTKAEATGRKIPLYVDVEQLKHTVHGQRECTDCHVDIVEIPHRAVKKVNCRRCHYAGNTVGAPQGELYEQYERSVHGMAVAHGNPKAPVCQDCHGTHLIYPLDSANSQVHRQNVPRTCGHCHIEEYAVYRESVHGVALAKGNQDVPVCSSCHGEHNIMGPKEASSSVSAKNVTRTCSDCHGSMGVVSKYGIKTDRIMTFEESFHGVAQIMNNQTVANCASCHGYHDIRSMSDPKSSVYPANIPATCGKKGCHPEANANFASGKIHVDPKSKESGILYYTSKFFMLLTVSTLAGLFVFILFDLYRRAKSGRSER